MRADFNTIGGKTDTSIVCNPATLGRKFCRFLRKYDNTFWAYKIIIVTFRTYNF